MPHEAARAALPFSGLGFDLEPVKAMAGAMALSLVRLDAPRARPRLRDMPRPAGYGLLVALSREIRGR
ncbi:hypothetical protein [Desulfocurvus sp. DL9XJH121]